MKILHVSDNHSVLYPLLGLDTCDVIVHSGDFLPNQRNRINPEYKFQGDWITNKITELKAWIGDKTFLFTPGNHDFKDPCPIMRSHGIDARNLHETVETIGGYSFYGFPYIPWMGGMWNYETFPPQMIEKTDRLVEIANNTENLIIVAHCPPYGIMDKNHWGQSIGNTALINALTYKITKSPKAVIFGHCHEASGLGYFTSPITNENILMSNAATTQRIIDV